MRARDIMTSPVHTVGPHASVESAAELLTARAVTALPVVDPDGLLLGMVSESDLLGPRVPSEPTDADHRPGTVEQVMSPYPLTTTPGTDVAVVAAAMLDNDVRSIPVLDGRTLVGIISRRDILRAMVRTDHAMTHDVQRRLDDYATDRPRWTATVESGVAAVTGDFDNDTERAVVTVLARTVPGVAAVKVTA